MIMKATDEQGAIVRAARALGGPHDGLKVSAFAGTGKTTILNMIDKNVRGRRLYLAYNRAIKEEAAGRFGSETDVKTLHGLAYSALRIARSGRKPGMPGLTALARALGSNAPDHGLIYEARATLMRWCQSNDTELALSHVNSGNPRRQEVLALARDLYALLRPGSKVRGLPIPHDLYVKEWGLQGAPLLDRYDLVYLDEAQDANPVVLQALQAAKSVIYVGDEHQQIYTWRGSVDAMRKVSFPEHHLTRSFRFGVRIANVANQILAHKRLSSPLYPIQGNPNIDSQLRTVNPMQDHTRIYRQNNDLIADAIQLRRLKKQVHLVGDREELITMLQALSALREGKAVRHPLLAGVKDWPDLLQRLQTQRGRDSVLSQGVRLMDDYSGNLERVYEVLAMVETPDEGAPDGILCTTAHRSKGREWNSVVLGSDFQRVLAQADPGAPLDGEMNLLYVAVTRARQVLDITQCAYLGALLGVV